MFWKKKTVTTKYDDKTLDACILFLTKLLAEVMNGHPAIMEKLKSDPEIQQAAKDAGLI